MALDSHPLLWVPAGLLRVSLSPHKEFFPVGSTCVLGVSPPADPLSALGVTRGRVPAVGGTCGASRAALELAVVSAMEVRYLVPINLSRLLGCVSACWN